MLFYDFEVFSHDWLVVITDSDNQSETVIHNDLDALQLIYDLNKTNIWVGYNSNGYDRYIMKALLCGFTAQEMNDWIIVKKRKGWEFSRELHKIQLYNYDVQTNRYHSLKQLEAFMGHDIRETTVPFDIDRPLTNEELAEVIYYCRHDVHETIEVFMRNISEFNAHLALINEFDLPLKHISKTQAQLAAIILNAQRGQDFDDEFDIHLPETVIIDKYTEVYEFYKHYNENSKDLDINISGVPHTFAAGGVHGAIKNYHHECADDELMIMADVAQLYPFIMVEYDLLSRNVKEPEKFKNIVETSLRLKAEKKKKQREPFKRICNITYGSEGDKYNPMYDPRNRLLVCIYGQLFLLDLIEKLEVIKSYELIQSNTDGILVKIKRKDFDLFDGIVFEWEQRTRLIMEFDYCKKINQKDVNNYIMVDYNGEVKSKGAYVKELSELDNDLPIVNRAVRDYFVHGTSVEETIHNSDSLIDFQKVTKISGKFDYAIFGTRKQYLKVFRLFAAKTGNELRKVKGESIQKISYTPDVCRIVNEDIVGQEVPNWVDRDWYIQLADKRITDFLGN